ncbi:hypothetical protein BH10ACT2_BH10ACT2_11050 [soil metagenome]
MLHGKLSRGFVAASLLVGLVTVAPVGAAAAFVVHTQVRQTLATGRYHTLVVKENGELFTFGGNGYGQLGNGTSDANPHSTPVDVRSDVVAVAAGDEHSLALLSDGSLLTFGANNYGQLGLSPADSSPHPTPTQVMSDVVAIAANGEFSLVLQIDGSLWSFGYNYYGQLGIGSTDNAAHATPTKIMTGVASMAAGKSHSLVVKTDGTLWTFGRNDRGQLGDGSTVLNPTPTWVAGVSDITAVAAGSTHSLALQADGTVLGFGGTEYGQLFLPNDNNPHSTPLELAVGATAIAAREDHSFALNANGELVGWGYNFFGQLGTAGGTNQVQGNAASVAMSDVTEVATGNAFTVALKTDGTIRTFGLNGYGQLGNGDDSTASDSTQWEVASQVLQPSSYRSLVPARLMDTRTGGSTVDHSFEANGVRTAGSTTALTVAGRGDVALDADAVSLNVTVTGAQSNGFATIYPCASGRPNASNLNFVAGPTIPNAVISKIDAAGEVCVYTSAAANVIVDVNGFFPATSTYTSLVPGRLLDTRPNSTTVDHQFEALGLRPANSTTQLTVGGRGNVPADAVAVVLNVTVSGAQATGFVTVFPCGTTRPNASNLNYATALTTPNLVITQIGVAEAVCIYTKSAANLIADVAGYYPASSTFHSLVPGRVMDSRVPASPTVDGAFQAIGRRAAGSVTQLQITERGQVPVHATTVALNVTVTGAQSNGFVTVYPCGTTQPNASNLNFAVGRTIANLVVSQIGDDGTVCIFTSAAVDIIADVSGYYDGYILG